MRTKKDKGSKSDRRDFLKLAGIGAVAGGAAVLGGPKKAEAAAVDAPSGRGYRETEHVKKFYRSARF
jgi:anaerobic selenocysteine-containing dehydrogenase